MARRKRPPSVRQTPGTLRQILMNTRLSTSLFLSSLFLVSMITLTVWGERGLPAVWHRQHSIVRLVQDIEAIEQENNRLGHEVQLLRSDMHYIEKIAREELGLVRPKELVFEFVESDH
jgi:cell division protein FtsB